MSSTVDKALGLLAYFTQTHPELGLSELARRAGADKATVHRMLGALCKHGMLEQDSSTKLYRLGAATLRLARNREASFPIAMMIEGVLNKLTAKTGETSHASMIAGNALATIGIVEGTSAIHVTLDAGESLPFHATASGIACLAFMPPERVRLMLSRKLASFTERTETSAPVLQQMIDLAYVQRIAHSDQSYEADVYGIAAPVFGSDGHACGAIAIATPAHRMTPNLKQLFGTVVRDAAIEVTRKLGAEPPQSYLSRNRKAAA